MIDTRLKRQIQAPTKMEMGTFLDVLSEPLLIKKIEDVIPEHRNRVYSPLQTLSLFLSQAFSADGSCQNAVNELNAFRASQGLPAVSSETTAYCKARQSLPFELIHQTHQHIAQQMERLTPKPWKWMGKSVRLIDGTTVSMSDTEKNQRFYPQHGNQVEGAGFPLARLVAMICYSTGALLSASVGPFKGKETGEQALLRQQLSTLNPGDLLLGDAIYGSYHLLWYCQKAGIDVLFEQFGARQSTVDFRTGKKIGAKDHLITLKKPKRKPDWMKKEEFDEMPDTLTLREIRAGKKVLITSLFCPKKFTRTMLKKLFEERWHVELDLRNMKSTLGMDFLKCKSPDMILKELWVYFLAYNILRLLIAQSAWLHKKKPRHISFKHTLQLWLAWKAHDLEITGDSELFRLIAQKTVGNRPGRIEPRVVKRRPKPYDRLQGSREEYRMLIKLYGHPKKRGHICGKY